MKLRELYLTFDVEPFWTNIPIIFGRDAWDSQLDDSAKWTVDFIDYCNKNNLPATFFIVGEWARRNSDIVKLIGDNKNFQIGSHSHWHEDLALKNDDEFIEDVRLSKNVIEDLISRNICRFRAPSFSLRPDQVSLLANIGFEIDSSITTAKRLYGSQNSPVQFPDNMHQIPYESKNIFGVEFTVLGGGYLRLLPTPVLKACSKLHLGNMIYLHPHDLPDRIDSYEPFTWKQNLAKTIRFGNMFDKIDSLRKYHKIKAL